MNEFTDCSPLCHQLVPPPDSTCFRLLDSSYLPELIELQSRVVNSLPKKEYLAVSPPAVLSRNLAEAGITLGAFAKERLIGYASMHFLAHYRSGEQTDIPFDDGSLLPRSLLPYAALYKQAMVHPDFRGNSLLKAMAVQLSDQAIRSVGCLRYFFAMAHPHNYASLNQLFTHGLVAVHLQKNRHGWWRLVFFRDRFWVPKPVDDYVLCPGSDYQRIQSLLTSGYRGTGLEKTNQDTMIVFQKNIQ